MPLEGLKINGPVMLPSSSTLATWITKTSLDTKAVARESWPLALSLGICWSHSQHTPCSPSSLAGGWPHRTIVFLGPTSRWTLYSSQSPAVFLLSGVGRMRKQLSPSRNLYQLLVERSAPD